MKMTGEQKFKLILTFLGKIMTFNVFSETKSPQNSQISKINVKRYVTKMLTKSCNLSAFSICKLLCMSIKELVYQINQNLHD